MIRGHYVTWKICLVRRALLSRELNAPLIPVIAESLSTDSEIQRLQQLLPA